jgi:hypothetical protein
MVPGTQSLYLDINDSNAFIYSQVCPLPYIIITEKQILFYADFF